jgi:hypothetical protein
MFGLVYSIPSDFSAACSLLSMTPLALVSRLRASAACRGHQLGGRQGNADEALAGSAPAAELLYGRQGARTLSRPP